MLDLKSMGTFDEVPKIVEDLVRGDTGALEICFATGWDINAPIALDSRTGLKPLSMALITECAPSIKWLAEHGASLNDKSDPAFLLAARYCGGATLQYLAAQGADINGCNNVGADAFQQALYGERLENLPVIHQLGHTVAQFGGRAFRMAVDDENYPALDFFVEHGVDVNYQKSDMVYPFQPTPLCVAARYVNLKMCKYLVDHGADVTIGEKGGMRPYAIAIEKGDSEMAEYFKALEPPEFHSLQNKLDGLREYKLPKKLIDFLCGTTLRLEFGPNLDIKWLEFFSLTDTAPMQVGRQKLLRLSKAMDNYSDLQIVWNPKAKKIAYYDEEHGELRNIAAFDDFMQEPGMYLQKVVDGAFS